MEIMPGTEGLLHISQIAESRIRRGRGRAARGRQVLVKVIEIDGNGKIRLSRRAALKDPEAAAAGAEKLTGQPDPNAPEPWVADAATGAGTGSEEATGARWHRTGNSRGRLGAA